jgi:predicted N-acetyltransferase YhbS
VATPSEPAAGDLDLRPATEADDPAVLALLEASMGWVPDDQHRAFFRWKHRENPHGTSPTWVAVDGDRVVGLRTFLRWSFHHGDHTVRAVRAVDTATHPDYQGRGIFSRLTLHGLDALAEEGVDWVFNTPNQHSLPGYLKMGWQEVGRLPVSFRPRSLAALPRLARARTPADKWSTAPGRARGGRQFLDITTALDEGGPDLVRPLTDRHPPPGTAGTVRSPDHLAWRYGFPPLQYRALPLGDHPRDGLAVFRLRHRGPALEAALTEVLTPPDSTPTTEGKRRRQAVASVLKATGADHAVQLRPARFGHGTLPLPGQGPLLVARRTGDDAVPLPEIWDLDLGDVELF